MNLKLYNIISYLSTHVEASMDPSGENRHDITFPEWPSNFIRSDMFLVEPVVIYHNFTRSSLPHVATV